MDAVNWLVHGKHGDAPECAAPCIRDFVIPGNDAMPHDHRQRLLPYLHRIAGSRSPAHEPARVRILQLAAVRIFAPRAFDAAGLHDHAARLRSLPDDVSREVAAAEVRAAEVEAEAAVVWAVANAAQAAQAAARAAARAAAWDDYFAVLDSVLTAGPQGEPWSADVVASKSALFVQAGGVAERVS
jgi:membrane protein involved in colicin uptake